MNQQTTDAPTAPAPPQTSGVDVSTDPQPNLLAGKYENRDALNKGIAEAAKLLNFGELNPTAVGDDQNAVTMYQGLQRLLNQRGVAAKAGDPTVPPAQVAPKPGEPMKLGGDTPTPDDDPDIAQTLTSVGLNIEEVVQQYQQHGQLTDDQYAALKAKGWGRNAVNAIAAGQAAQAQLQAATQQNIHAEAARIAGGEAQLNTLLATAKNFVPADEVDALDKMLGDPGQYKIAIGRIMEHHRAAVGSGKAKPLINGDAVAAGSEGIIAKEDMDNVTKRAALGDQRAVRRLQSHVRSGGKTYL